MSLRKIRNFWGHFGRSLLTWAGASEENFLKVLCFGGLGGITIVLTIVRTFRLAPAADYEVLRWVNLLTTLTTGAIGGCILYHWHKWDKWHKGL